MLRSNASVIFKLLQSTLRLLLHLTTMFKYYILIETLKQGGIAMDKSKKYINMCEQAKEIQSLWKREDYDWFVDIGTTDACRINYCNDAYYEIDPEIEAIWLPRQDQLQNMMGIELHTHVKNNGLVDKFRIFYYWEQDDFEPNADIKQFESMEQLWLACVMYYKFHKDWSNTKTAWVNIEAGADAND